MIADLQKELLSSDDRLNTRYLEWKYEKTPDRRDAFIYLGELCLLGRFIEVPDVLFLRRVHPAASSQMKGDERRLFKLMTGRSGRIMLPEWQRVGGHLRSAVRSELQLRDKASLVGALARQAFRRRERLLREATCALGRARQ
jgi:hypothetical protein